MPRFVLNMKLRSLTTTFEAIVTLLFILIFLACLYFAFGIRHWKLFTVLLNYSVGSDPILTISSKEMSPCTRASGKRKKNRLQERRAGPGSPICKVDANQKVALRRRSDRISKSKETASKVRPHGDLKHRQCRKEQFDTERRKRYPEEFPDLDFHNSFGSFLTRKNPVARTVDAQIARYWQLLSQSPTLLQRHIYDISDRYRDAFGKFFGADPISLHGHVSDASNPALLTSLISHLISHASSTCRLLRPDGEAMLDPRIAVTDGSYGAGYGPLAYNAVVESCRPLANGSRPIVIGLTNAGKIDAQVKAAKGLGCVTLIAEIVSARDGKVMGESAWKSLLKACERYGVFLVVDEAMTSIRCGAPFAHQLPQYRKHGLPDLILFGKAIRTNGIAVEWRGINVAKLGIDDDEGRLFAILDWQERLTEMAPAADLLISWGTLVLAEEEQWPQRAQVIGRLLRSILRSDGIKPTNIGGVHSLIYLRKHDNARLSSPVMGAKAGSFVRWLPVMDNVMTAEDHLLSKIFGSGSRTHRKNISAYLRSQDLRLGFCSSCGNPVDEDETGCEICVVRKCEDCESEEHVCPMERSFE